MTYREYEDKIAQLRRERDLAIQQLKAIFLDGQLTNCNPPFIQALSPDYKYLIYYEKDLEHWCMKTEPTLKKE